MTSNSGLTNNFERITIVGVGMLGGSIAKDARAKFAGSTIMGCDLDPVQLQAAVSEGYVDATVNLGEVASRSDLVIIATPLETVVDVAGKIYDSARTNTHVGKILVMDTASVKTNITAEFEKLTDDKVEFVSTHPMAGTEFTGFAHSRKNLFKAKPWMVCTHSKNSENGIAVAEAFIKALGAKTREIDPVSHDRSAALVSHAVILLSNYIFDYIAETNPAALDFAGDGFTSTTRLASGNPALHEAIVSMNLANVEEVLSGFSQYLSERLASEQLAPSGFFDANKTKRDAWLHKRK